MNKPYPEPRYLGDGVYVQVNPDAEWIELSTGSHRRTEATNHICLDNDTIKALKKFISDVEQSQL